jgi:hypothetical protein
MIGKTLGGGTLMTNVLIQYVSGAGWKMFQKKISKSFLVYFVVGVISTVISTILLYVGRELFFISVVILNPAITLLMFFVKYIMYDKGGMVQKETKHQETKPCMCQTVELMDR